MSRHRAPRGLTIGGVATAAATAVALLGAGSVAYAAWATSGTGAAAAKAGTSRPLTTTAVAVTTGLLYPDGPAGDVRLTIVNPNPYAVRVTHVAPAGAITATGGGSCATHGVSLAPRTGAWDVAAGTSATYTLAGAASMSGAAENGCQAATFTIPVVLTGASTS